MFKRIAVVMILTICICGAFISCAKKEAPATMNPISFIPSGAMGLLIVDVVSLRNESFYDTLWEQSAAIPEMQNILDQLKEKTGLDPRNDLEQLVAAIYTIDEGNGLMVVSYDGSKKDFDLEDALGEFNPTVSDYEGTKIFRDETNTFLCKPTPGILLIGSEEARITTAVDLFNGKGKSVMSDKEIMNFVQTITPDAFFKAAFMVTEDMKSEMSSQQTGMMPGADLARMDGGTISLALLENLDIRGNILFEDAESATKTKTQIDGYLGFFKMMGASQQDEDAQKMMNILNRLQIAAEETALSLSLYITRDEIKQLMAQATKEMQETIPKPE